MNPCTGKVFTAEMMNQQRLILSDKQLEGEQPKATVAVLAQDTNVTYNAVANACVEKDGTPSPAALDLSRTSSTRMFALTTTSRRKSTLHSVLHREVSRAQDVPGGPGVGGLSGPFPSRAGPMALGPSGVLGLSGPAAALPSAGGLFPPPSAGSPGWGDPGNQTLDDIVTYSVMTSADMHCDLRKNDGVEVIANDQGNCTTPSLVFPLTPYSCVGVGNNDGVEVIANVSDEPPPGGQWQQYEDCEPNCGLWHDLTCRVEVAETISAINADSEEMNAKDEKQDWQEEYAREMKQFRDVCNEILFARVCGARTGRAVEAPAFRRGAAPRHQAYHLTEQLTVISDMRTECMEELDETISAINADTKEMKVKAMAGDTQYGGEEFDNHIVDCLQSGMCTRTCSLEGRRAFPRCSR